MVQVICQFADARSSIPNELQEEIGKWEVALAPLHPKVEDELLKSYFFCTLDNEENASHFCKFLLSYDFVAAAYVKAPDGPPG